MPDTNTINVGDEIFTHGKHGPQLYIVTRVSDRFVWSGDHRWTRSKRQFRVSEPGDQDVVATHLTNKRSLSTASSNAQDVAVKLDELCSKLRHASRYQTSRGPALLSELRRILNDAVAQIDADLKFYDLKREPDQPTR